MTKRITILLTTLTLGVFLSACAAQEKVIEIMDKGHTYYCNADESTRNTLAAQFVFPDGTAKAKVYCNPGEGPKVK